LARIDSLGETMHIAERRSPSLAFEKTMQTGAKRKVLVVGSGGREHALALRLLSSPSVAEVIVVPGNAGTVSAPSALAAHSAGGALALVAALKYPQRVRALALYEPTLFSLVEQPNDVDGIRNAADAAIALVNAGDPVGAARRFIDFWMGGESFDRMPERNREAITASIASIEAWKEALFGEPTPLAAFARLDIPVLLVTGSRSPLSSRAVTQRLRRVLPRVEVEEIEGLGHMGPVTHPQPVNEAIARFLEKQ
jgi:pimeloyl-ACP methyl ester carboxylesterase